MTDFKLGETVYWFYMCRGNIELRKSIISEMSSRYLRFRKKIFLSFDYEQSVYADECYKSKKEAIDAMIKKLEEMKG